MIVRGALVIVDFRPTDPSAKTRPALVIQNDLRNKRIRKTIVVQITGNLKRANDPDHYLINHAHPDWLQSGLRTPSLVSCINITTIPQGQVLSAIGSLSKATLAEIDVCLKVGLGIS
jgi:mRNA interferase MazF